MQNLIVCWWPRLVCGGGGAFAEDTASGGDNLKVTLGLKAWSSTWETSETLNSSSARYVGSITSDPTFAMIPSISARLKDWLVSASYFKQSYTPPNTSYDTYYQPKKAYGTVAFNSHTADREEYDINVGYYFLPSVAVSLGYKTIKLSHSYTFQWTTPLQPSMPSSYDVTYKTPIIGIQASAQLGGSSFYLYGNGAISIGNSLTREDSTATTTSDGSYSAAELGVGYAISKNMVFSIGTKYQVANVKDSSPSSNGTFRDVTSGLTAGISYTF